MFGKGGFGRGRGSFGRGQQLPFERFPEIEGLGKAKYLDEDKNPNMQLLRWATELQNFWKMSPYYYEPAKKKVEKPDIERYSDREQGGTNKKRPLEDYIFMDADHLPGELVKAGGARVAKNVRWNMEMDASKFDDAFRMVEQKAKEKQKESMRIREAEKEDKDEEDEDDEVKDDDDDESDVDSGIYSHNEDCDDDEDDYNKADDDDDNDGIY